MKGKPGRPLAVMSGREDSTSRSAVPLLDDEEGIGAAHAEDRRFVWALARGLEILRAFGPERTALSVGRLSAMTGMAKPTVSRLTHTLAALGYLRVVDKRGHYAPTPAVLTLGYPVLSALKVQDVATAPMRELAEATGCLVGLGARDRLSMVFAECTPPSWLVTLRLGTGSRVPMATSALGRAFLAGLGEAERDYLLGRLALRHGAEWEALGPRVADGIEQVRARGFCIVDGEWQRDVRTAACPLITADGVMGLMAGAPGYTITNEILENEVGPRLVELAAKLSPLIGS